MLYFSSINARYIGLHVSVRCVNFTKTNFTNKIMALQNGKCHFVSEQQLISSITRNRYSFN